MSIADKLLQVNQAKLNIKAAIETKGVSTSGVPFTNYANKILDISGGGGMTYEDYVRTFYLGGGKSNQFATAWEHSLIVDPLEISANSNYSSPRGTAQYPDGEVEGVIIPEGVTSIGAYAFDNWPSNNQPLVIPSSVTSIGTSAFRDWTSNNHPLVIPNSVTSIRGNAFNAWASVPYIEIQAITPPTLANTNAFDNQNDAPIYVPDESVDDYKTATNWVDLADRIFSINDL